MTEEYCGECLCGAVRYRIVAPVPSAMFMCHCSRCRKETGSAHGANVFFSSGKLTWERGATCMTYFELEGTRKARQFCSACGSPMPRKSAGGSIVLPAGSLDDGAELEPTAHIFCASGSSWETRLDALPRFDELPPPSS